MGGMVAADADVEHSTSATRRATLLLHAMAALLPTIASPVPAVAPDELEAVLVAIADREASESDVERLALLRRGRVRLERQLAELLVS
jgi:hypothetical protein